MLPDGYTDLPAGKIAAVVTYLEMRRPSLVEAPLPVSAPDLSVERLEKPDLDRYRRIYRAVGEEWLWFSRMLKSDAELAKIIHDPQIEVSALRSNDEDKGLLELDYRYLPTAELTFFGVTADLIGQGAGRFLMSHALHQAWSHPIDRLFVHTCTLDHPRAVSFYMKSGFTPFKRAVEIADDPRLQGALPLKAAPHFPVIR